MPSQTSQAMNRAHEARLRAWVLEVAVLVTPPLSPMGRTPRLLRDQALC